LGNRRNKGAGKGKAIGMDFLRENGVSFGHASSHSGSSSDSDHKSSDSEDEKKSSKSSSNDDQVRKTISSVGEKINKRILYASSDTENEDVRIGNVENGGTEIKNFENGDIGTKNSKNDSDHKLSDSEGENKSSKNSSDGNHVRNTNSPVVKK